MIEGSWKGQEALNVVNAVVEAVVVLAICYFNSGVLRLP